MKTLEEIILDWQEEKERSKKSGCVFILQSDRRKLATDIRKWALGTLGEDKEPFKILDAGDENYWVCEGHNRKGYNKRGDEIKQRMEGT